MFSVSFYMNLPHIFSQNMCLSGLAIYIEVVKYASPHIPLYIVWKKKIAALVRKKTRAKTCTKKFQMKETDCAHARAYKRNTRANELFHIIVFIIVAVYKKMNSYCVSAVAGGRVLTSFNQVLHKYYILPFCYCECANFAHIMHAHAKLTNREL